MKTLPPVPRGFALIPVMTIIFVLAILAGGFAYSMKVETRLAANANNESEVEWMGRSGVEMAKYILDQSARLGTRPTSLKQIWAGGPGDERETNSTLVEMIPLLKRCDLGPGYITVRITDLESKLNLNRISAMAPAQGAGQEVLRRALDVMRVEPGEISVVTDSILDWKDPDDNTSLSGVESDFYLMQNPPYYAKNGPFDDLAELLLVNGVTPEMYWGPRAPAHQFQLVDAKHRRRGRDRDAPPSYPFGLVDLFTPISAGAVDLNTASSAVLQVALGIPDNLAADIIRARAGFDGVDGTEDDMPFPSANLASMPGLEAIPPMLRAPTTVVSTHFEAVVDVWIGTTHRQCVALLGRGLPGGHPNEGGVKVLQFSWRY